MSATQFHQPQSLADASALLRSKGSGRILAGGTDLLVQMRSGMPLPQSIVDIKAIAGMLDVTLTDKQLALHRVSRRFHAICSGIR